MGTDKNIKLHVVTDIKIKSIWVIKNHKQKGAGCGYGIISQGH